MNTNEKACNCPDCKVSEKTCGCPNCKRNDGSECWYHSLPSPEPLKPEQVRHIADHALPSLLHAALFEDSCPMHGEECPVAAGGECRHYSETYRFHLTQDAKDAARLAFILGRVYELNGPFITFWPFAACVPAA